jgi:hypothetical protein
VKRGDGWRIGAAGGETSCRGKEKRFSLLDEKDQRPRLFAGGALRGFKSLLPLYRFRAVARGTLSANVGETDARSKFSVEGE